VWGCHFLPQNREIFATAGGNGSLTLHKYCYPAERKVDAGEGLEKGVAGTVRQEVDAFEGLENGVAGKVRQNVQRRRTREGRGGEGEGN
jgi:hypothetical protein